MAKLPSKTVAVLLLLAVVLLFVAMASAEEDKGDFSDHLSSHS